MMLSCFPGQKPRSWRSDEGFAGVGVDGALVVNNTDSDLISTSFDTKDILGSALWLILNHDNIIISVPSIKLGLFDHYA